MVQLTNQSADYQRRDKEHYDQLKPEIRERFKRQAKQIVMWLDKEYKLSTHKILLHRISDAEGRTGDVADLRISFGKHEIALSLKNNHEALKHPRPPSVAQWIGIPKNEDADVKYRKAFEEIRLKFFSRANQIAPGATLFREVKIRDKNIINNLLYKPVCELVILFLTEQCKSKGAPQNLFKFLVSQNYYKIICNSLGVEIFPFFDIKLPTSVTFQIEKKSYICMQFSNGWQIKMRLHNAEDKLTSSLKFDAQLTEPKKLLRHFIL